MYFIEFFVVLKKQIESRLQRSLKGMGIFSPDVICPNDFSRFLTVCFLKIIKFLKKKTNLTTNDGTSVLILSISGLPLWLQERKKTPTTLVVYRARYHFLIATADGFIVAFRAFPTSRLHQEPTKVMSDVFFFYLKTICLVKLFSPVL